jgi:hypothetical protein
VSTEGELEDLASVCIRLGLAWPGLAWLGLAAAVRARPTLLAIGLESLKPRVEGGVDAPGRVLRPNVVGIHVDAGVGTRVGGRVGVRAVVAVVAVVGLALACRHLEGAIVAAEEATSSHGVGTQRGPAAPAQGSGRHPCRRQLRHEDHRRDPTSHHQHLTGFVFVMARWSPF